MSRLLTTLALVLLPALLAIAVGGVFLVEGLQLGGAAALAILLLSAWPAALALDPARAVPAALGGAAAAVAIRLAGIGALAATGGTVAVVTCAACLFAGLVIETALWSRTAAAGAESPRHG